MFSIFLCRLGGVAQEMKCDFLLVIFYFVLFKNFLVRTGLYFLILFNSAFFLSSIKRSTFWIFFRCPQILEYDKSFVFENDNCAALLILTFKSNLWTVDLANSFVYFHLNLKAMQLSFQHKWQKDLKEKIAFSHFDSRTNFKPLSVKFS